MFVDHFELGSSKISKHSDFDSETARYGKKEGFTNVTLKRVHDVGCTFQSTSDLSLHENVVEYEEDR